MFNLIIYICHVFVFVRPFIYLLFPSPVFICMQTIVFGIIKTYKICMSLADATFPNLTLYLTNPITDHAYSRSDAHAVFIPGDKNIIII